MGIRADWARRAAKEELRVDLGHQAGSTFLTYASSEAARVENLASTSTAAAMLGWALAGARVDCEGADIPPGWLRDVAFDLYRRGEHLSRILTSPDRPIRLLRQSSWSWNAGDADPETWIAETTETGPHDTSTRNLGWEALVRIDWSSDPSSPYVGRPATATARDTAHLAASIEVSLSREAAGDVAQIIAVPQAAEGADSTDSTDNDDMQADPMAALRDDLSAAKGRDPAHRAHHEQLRPGRPRPARRLEAPSPRPRHAHSRSRPRRRRAPPDAQHNADTHRVDKRR